MNWRTTAILAGIVLILGGYVFWDSRRVEEPELPDIVEDDFAPEPTPIITNLFEGVTLDNFSELEIVATQGMTTTNFVVVDGVWSQTVPTQTLLVDSTMVNQVTGLITLQSRLTLLPDASELSDFGLDDPEYRMTVRYQRDDQLVRITLLVGDELATTDGYYVQLQGDPRVHVIGSSIVTSMLSLAEMPPLPIPTPTPAPVDS